MPSYWWACVSRENHWIKSESNSKSLFSPVRLKPSTRLAVTTNWYASSLNHTPVRTTRLTTSTTSRVPRFLKMPCISFVASCPVNRIYRGRVSSSEWPFQLSGTGAPIRYPVLCKPIWSQLLSSCDGRWSCNALWRPRRWVTPKLVAFWLVTWNCCLCSSSFSPGWPHGFSTRTASPALIRTGAVRSAAANPAAATSLTPN